MQSAKRRRDATVNPLFIRDLLCIILFHCSQIDIVNVSMICKHLRQVIFSHPSTMRLLTFKRPDPVIVYRFGTGSLTDAEVFEEPENVVWFYDNIINLKEVDDVDNLPRSIEKLSFAWHFDRPVYSLPSSLREITFGDEFQHPVDSLPDGLEKLKFGRIFGQSLDKLPSTLKTLTLGKHFVRRLDNLPSGLQVLELGYLYNQPLDHLPEGLERLELGMKFNQPINSLPSTIKYLSLGAFYRTPIEKLPASLVQIQLYEGQQDLIASVPKNTKICRC